MSQICLFSILSYFSTSELNLLLSLFQVLNLFLALLLSSFGAESLQSSKSDDEPNKLQEAIDRIVRFTHWIKMSLLKCAKYKFKKKRPINRPELPKVDINGKEIIGDGHAIIGNGKFGEKLDENAVTPTNQGKAFTCLKMNLVLFLI